jgi:serine O-acetyltransferase
MATQRRAVDNRGFHPVPLFRLSRRLYLRGSHRPAHAIKALLFFVFKAVLPPEVQAGEGLQINHRGMGVVVHPNTTLGRNVTLQHGVTIANKHFVSDKQFTHVGDEVTIGAHAVIVGPLNIGSGATIGAGAIVTKDVPPGETWAGNPARRIGGTG